MATVTIVPEKEREADPGLFDAHTRDGAYIGSFPTPAYAAAEMEMVEALEDGLVFHMPRPNQPVTEEQLFMAYEAFVAQYDPETRCFVARDGILRTEPGLRTKKSIVAHVEAGLRASVLDEHDDGEWVKVRVGDDEGWIQRTALHMPIRDRAQAGMLLAIEEGRLNIRVDRVVVRGEQGNYTIYSGGDCYCRDSTRQDRHQLTMGWCKHVIACDLVGRAQEAAAAEPVAGDAAISEDDASACALDAPAPVAVPVVADVDAPALAEIAAEPPAPDPAPATLVAAPVEAVATPEGESVTHDPMAVVILPLKKLAGLWFHAFINGGPVVVEMEEGRLTVILGEQLDDAATVQGEGDGQGSLTLSAEAFGELWKLFAPIAKTAARTDTRLVNVFLDLEAGEVLYAVQEEEEAAHA